MRSFRWAITYAPSKAKFGKKGKAGLLRHGKAIASRTTPMPQNIIESSLRSLLVAGKHSLKKVRMRHKQRRWLGAKKRSVGIEPGKCRHLFHVLKVEKMPAAYHRRRV